MNRPLGCLTGSALLAAVLASLAILGAAAASGNGIFSPGELNRQTGAESIGGIASHADVSQTCAACHPAFWSRDRMGDRCLTCHAHVQEEIRLDSGLHAGFATSANCRNCHTDHQGPSAALTRSDMRGFPHERTGYMLWAHPLTSEGGEFKCTDCHPDSLSAFDVAVCLTCHTDFDLAYSLQHRAAFGVECITCHDGVDSFGHDFDHQALDFRLEGKHAEAECVLCHRAAKTVEDLRSAPTACIACHAPSDIHAGRLGLNCGECHDASGWEDASLDHGRTRFSLTGSHVEVECLECHVDRTWTGIGTACRTCHVDDDRHNGQFDVDCADCHTTVAWSDVIFDHARTGFALEAAHDVSCSTCHADGQYVGTPSSCAGCHASEDDHNGRFGKDCGACHRPTRWSDATFDHNLVGFRLTGAHARVACESCHTGGRFAGTSSSCSSCHNRPSSHGSSFSGACSNCHSTSAWRPASFNGPHPFPMNHGGAGGNCSTCHPSSWFDYSCTGCHEHDASRMQDKHREVSGFSMGACLNCHPGGRGGDD